MKKALAFSCFVMGILAAKLARVHANVKTPFKKFIPSFSGEEVKFSMSNGYCIRIYGHVSTKI